MRIKLIVTGDLERTSIVASLQRHFPQSDNGSPIDWLTPRKIHCTTSNPLQSGKPPSSAMKTLANALIAEAEFGENGSPADLVVAVDDLELANQGQPDVVIDHLKRAVEEQINAHADYRRKDRLRTTLREKCSFHFFAPMVESYFFGDRTALASLGIKPQRSLYLQDPDDVENFETADPAWLRTCAEENQRKTAGGWAWWKHERHPKHYLEFLTDENEHTYQETVNGATAFKALNWATITAKRTATKFVRSLFEDLADALAIPNPFPGDTAQETWPSRSIDRQTLLLRNL